MKRAIFLALQLASHLAYMILLPLFIFGGGGLLLDRKLHTLPTYLLVGVVIAFLITLYWMRQKLREIIESIK